MASSEPMTMQMMPTTFGHDDWLGRWYAGRYVGGAAPAIGGASRGDGGVIGLNSGMSDSAMLFLPEVNHMHQA